MLDTCVIVAAIRSGAGASSVLVNLAVQPNSFFEPVLNEALASEYEDVIYRTEHRTPAWTEDDLHELVQSLLVPAHWAATNFSYRPLLQDVGDELVLEAALNGQAKFILTFNVKHFEPAGRLYIQVIRPGEFLSLMTKKG